MAHTEARRIARGAGNCKYVPYMLKWKCLPTDQVMSGTHVGMRPVWGGRQRMTGLTITGSGVAAGNCVQSPSDNGWDPVQ